MTIFSASLSRGEISSERASKGEARKGVREAGWRTGFRPVTFHRIDALSLGSDYFDSLF